jgi:hypothetical protein
MTRFVRDYLVRLSHQWLAIFIGIAFAAFGFLKAGLGFDIPMPSRFWWTAALVTLFVSQHRVYRDLYRQYEAILSPESDCTLAQAVDQIVASNPNDGRSTKVSNALVQLRQKARLDLISVWARAGREIDPPLKPVGAEIWDTQRFDYLAYLKDQKGQLEPTKPHAWADYIDFHFNREQIARCWPKPWFWTRLVAASRAVRDRSSGACDRYGAHQ